jgi:predicted DsbA family dithiol-disulfide isomerase
MFDSCSPADRTAMTVDVFADVACPFCYIGERHFEQALAEVRSEQEAPEIAWRWRPFQLQPGLPAEGTDWRPFAEKKFGSWERAQATFRRVEEMGEAAGVDFRFDRMEKAVNTTDAHRLVLWAGEQDSTGAQKDAAEALFAAYFTAGRDVGDAATLAQVAGEAGLDAGAAREMLASERFAGRVEESQQEARRLGVTGVPCYIFDGESEDDARAVTGAQPAAVFRRALAGGAHAVARR